LLYITNDSRPVLRCAICEHPIMLAREASVVYPRGLSPGSVHPVTITHSDYCRALAQEGMDSGAGPGLTMSLIEYGDRLRASPSEASTPGV
jgi:hypothetical protein